jgi:pyruvate dehydrogenase (quinone)
MACAHAKFTGEVGVCLATQGPGAIHLLNGLYDARSDHQPVVAIVGQQSTMAMGGEYQQELDLITLFKDVAGAYVQMVTSPLQVRHVIDRAVRIALAERTVTCVIVPHDLQDEDAVEEPPRQHGTMHSSVGWSPPRVLPTDADLRRAADVLNTGNKVALLVGAGALRATDEVIAVAEKLGAGVAKALLGKAAVPDDLPFVTGTVGWLGTRASNEMMSECDTLLMVGTAFPYTEFLPAEGQARAVQIDIDGRMVSFRYPTEVGLVGDSAETLRALLPLLQEKGDRAWRRSIEEKTRAWWREEEGHAMQPGELLNPRRLFWELSSRLPDGAIIAGDSGSSTVWYARDLKLRRGMRASLSGLLATMGSALPYATAAKFAYPDRPVIATMGDGAMQMSGLGALITVAKYWRRWQDPRLADPGAEQPRPELRDLGAAGDGGRAQVRAVAEPARRPVRAVRRAARAQGHPRRVGRPGGRGLGRGAVRRPAGPDRRGHRPDHADYPAGIEAGASREARRGAVEGRSGGRGDPPPAGARAVPPPVARRPSRGILTARHLTLTREAGTAPWSFRHARSTARSPG